MDRRYRILALWSVPRARSTAFLRMMVERGDHRVLHEPFCHLLDFGSVDVDGRTVRTEPDLIAAIRELGARTPVFFKDTTDFRYPGLLADEAFLRDAVHTFLIREPAAVIASHFALNRQLTCAEVGFDRLAEIYEAASRAAGRPPVVISSDDLVADPGGTVRAYCAAAGLPFEPKALSWAPGVLPEWRQTRRWHELTAATAGFTSGGATYADTTDSNPLLASYLDHHLPYYRRLYDRRLVPAGDLMREHN